MRAVLVEISTYQTLFVGHVKQLRKPYEPSFLMHRINLLNRVIAHKLNVIKEGICDDKMIMVVQSMTGCLWIVICEVNLKGLNYQFSSKHMRCS